MTRLRRPRLMVRTILTDCVGCGLPDFAEHISG
jgi:hypothetical protein